MIRPFISKKWKRIKNPLLVRLVALFVRRYPRFLVGSVLIGLLSGAGSAALMAIIGRRLSAAESSAAALALGYAALVALELAGLMLSGLLSIRFQRDASMALSLDFCRQFLAAPLRKIEETGNHRILAALSQDVYAVTDILIRIPQLSINIAVLAGCLIYLTWISETLVALLVAFLVFAVSGYRYGETRAKSALRAAREQWDEIVDCFRAVGEGAKELKLHPGRRRAFVNDLLAANLVAHRKNSTSGASVYVGLVAWSQTLYFIVVGLILFVAPRYLSQANTPVLTAYALTLLYMRGPLAAVIGIFPVLGQAQIAIKKIDALGLELYKTSPEVEQRIPARPLTFRQRLSLRGVTHRYYREKEGATFMLGPIDLDLIPGEIVFLVGANGSGKTTLAKLLVGLYSPESGEISFDGKAVTERTREEYRQFFSAVFTDSYLFDRLLGLDDASLGAAAAEYLVKLQLDHKVEIVNGRLSTIDLSSGQRKRLMLLTAYLEGRPIYMFDEWTAGQDPHFRDFFYFQTLPALKALGRSVFVITHDDRYFEVADRVLKLDSGKFDSESTAIALAPSVAESAAQVC